MISFSAKSHFNYIIFLKLWKSENKIEHKKVLQIKMLSFTIKLQNLIKGDNTRTKYKQKFKLPNQLQYIKLNEEN